MMTQNADKKREQIQFFCMDDLVPKDHLLRLIDKAIDWTFMTNPKEDQVKQAGDNGYSISEFDRMTARNAVKEVYSALRIFVSYFEGEYDVPLNMEDEGVNDIIAAYHYCWRVICRTDDSFGIDEELKRICGDLFS